MAKAVMNVTRICQILVALLLIAAFFGTVRVDIEGRKAKEPLGFKGIVVTVIMTILVALVYYGAGAFSQLLP